MSVPVSTCCALIFIPRLSRLFEMMPDARVSPVYELSAQMVSDTSVPLAYWRCPSEPFFKPMEFSRARALVWLKVYVGWLGLYHSVVAGGTPPCADVASVAYPLYACCLICARLIPYARACLK